MLYIDIWPFYSKVKFASLCICMGKTFKNLVLQNRGFLVAESLHTMYIIGNWRSAKVAKIMVVHWHLTFLPWDQFCFLMHLYGKNIQNFKRLLLWSLWANFAQILYGASLGWGNERLLKWSRFIDQDGRHAHIWEKPLKIFFSRTKDALGLNLCLNHRGQGVYQSC